MLLDAFILVFILALIGGGKLSRLAGLGLRWPLLFFFAMLLQAISLAGGLSGWGIARFAGAIYLFSYILLLVALVLNRHQKLVWIAAFGVALNVLVMAANGGQMPVERAQMERTGRPELKRLVDGKTKHVWANERTPLRFLDDNLVLPPPYPNPQVFSVGDVLVTVGVCWLVVSGMFGAGVGCQGSAAGGKGEEQNGRKETN